MATANLTTQTPIAGEQTFAETPVAATTPIDVAVNPTAEPIAYRRVYVWELPVRIFHWLNALCIVVLAATGYLIGNPPTLFDSAEPYQQYWFGWVRFTHFAAAYVFFFNFLFRVYWSIVGNRYAHWSSYVPYKASQF